MLLALFIFSLPALDHAFSATLHGSLENESAYFISGEKRFDKIRTRLELKPEVGLSERWEFRGRWVTSYDLAMDVELGNSSDLTEPIKDFYRYGSELKEAYLLYAGDDFDFRLGKQQIVWGKTDGLRLLDIANPLDYREFILDDFLDLRIGLWAARLNYYAYMAGQEHEFELLFIPDLQMAKFAPFGSRWGFQPTAFPKGIEVRPLPEEHPKRSLANSELGAAWRSRVAGWDLSLNWFYGWQDTPNIEKNLQNNTLAIRPRHFKMNTFGASLSNALAAFVLRAELGVNVGEGIDRYGLTPDTSIIRKNTFNAAIAIDYNQYHWTISPQLFMRHIFSWEPTLIESKNSGFVSLRLATDFMNEKLKPEVIALWDWDAYGWLLRPSIEYLYSDTITTSLAADIFGGTKGFFGQFADNDRLSIALVYSF
ncbi:MAG: DUF1302 family protein [Mariprofundaceae bacterium]